MEDADSKLVQLIDEAGNSVAEVVLGKIKYGLLGPGRNGVYVRVPGEAQTWLVSGDVSAPLDVRGWARKGVYEFSEDDVWRVAISHDDGEVLVYERQEDGDETSFRIADLPDGFVMKSNADLEFDVRSVAQLELWDVRSAAGAAVPADAREVTVDMTMLDGTNLTAHVVSEDKDTHWVSVFAWSTGEASERIDEINARARGWQFKIQTYKANYFIRRLEDVAELQDGEDEAS